MCLKVPANRPASEWPGYAELLKKFAMEIVPSVAAPSSGPTSSTTTSTPARPLDAAGCPSVDRPAQIRRGKSDPAKANPDAEVAGIPAPGSRPRACPRRPAGKERRRREGVVVEKPQEKSQERPPRSRPRPRQAFPTRSARRRAWKAPAAGAARHRRRAVGRGGGPPRRQRPCPRRDRTPAARSAARRRLRARRKSRVSLKSRVAPRRPRPSAAAADRGSAPSEGPEPPRRGIHAPDAARRNSEGAAAALDLRAEVEPPKQKTNVGGDAVRNEVDVPLVCRNLNQSSRRPASAARRVVARPDRDRAIETRPPASCRRVFHRQAAHRPGIGVVRFDCTASSRSARFLTLSSAR